MEIIPVGIIHTPYATKEACPIQPMYAASAIGHVEVFPQFAEGLKDVETFTHLHLLYQLDRTGKVELVRSTFLDDEVHGVFASRHPCRPNSIGMSIVKLVERRGNVLVVEGVDMLDKTPLIDIKPYLPKYDIMPDASEGWTGKMGWRPKPAGKE